MPTQRETRYDRLMNWGFLKAESTAFSRVDFDSPNCGAYWQEMFVRRDKQYRSFLQRGGTREGWIEHVKDFYKRKKWYRTETIKGHRKVRRLNPWLLAKALKSNYILRNPAWESPHVKTHRNFKRTQRRVDKELQYAEPPK